MNEENKKTTAADLVEWQKKSIALTQAIAESYRNEADPGIACWIWAVVGGFAYLACMAQNKLPEFNAFCLFLIAFLLMARWSSKPAIQANLKNTKNWYD